MYSKKSNELTISNYQLKQFNNMKYYTISMFSEGSLLESITTKQKVNSMPNKTIKLLMETYSADEAQLFESDSLNYQLTEGNPIRTIKL